MKIIKKKRHTCIYTFNVRVYIKSNIFVFIESAQFVQVVSIKILKKMKLDSKNSSSEDSNSKDTQKKGDISIEKSIRKSSRGAMNTSLRNIKTNKDLIKGQVTKG